MKTNVKSKKCAIACYVCGVIEKSKADMKLKEDWLKCCQLASSAWSHESCGEKSGLFTDSMFFCSKYTLIAI